MLFHTQWRHTLRGKSVTNACSVRISDKLAGVHGRWRYPLASQADAKPLPQRLAPEASSHETPGRSRSGPKKTLKICLERIRKWRSSLLGDGQVCTFLRGIDADGGGTSQPVTTKRFPSVSSAAAKTLDQTSVSDELAMRTCSDAFSVFCLSFNELCVMVSTSRKGRSHHRTVSLWIYWSWGF